MIPGGIFLRFFRVLKLTSTIYKCFEMMLVIVCSYDDSVWNGNRDNSHFNFLRWRIIQLTRCLAGTRALARGNFLRYNLQLVDLGKKDILFLKMKKSDIEYSDTKLA